VKGQTEFTPPETDINVEMPKPLNWKILVRPLKAQTISDGGIEMTDKTQKDQEFITIVGQIVAMGDQAYKSQKLEDRNNPKVGDWVLWATYGGQRIEMADGRVYYIMSDDHVTCVVDDPELYRKKLV